MEQNVLHGPKPANLLEDGTAGQYIYNILKKYRSIPNCVTDPQTESSISYEELLKTTCRLAEAFINNGYQKNTVVSICSENNVYFTYPVIAALYAGLIVAPINQNYTERECIHMYNIVKPEIIFCSKKTLSKIRLLKRILPCIKLIVILDGVEDDGDAEAMKNFIDRGCNNLLDVDNFKPACFNRNEQYALIMSSSGTTGLPKCVILTHKNLMTRFNQCKDMDVATAIHVKPGGAVLNILPLFHVFGMSVTLGYLTLGLHIIQMQGYEEHLFLKSIQKYNVESTLIVPAVMMLLARSTEINNYDVSSLTELGCGAAPLSKDTIAKIQRKFNIKEIRQGYGLTESTILITITPLNNKKLTSTGKLLPFTSAKIINPDTQQNLGPNETGEICAKGGTIMKGYLNDIDATKMAIDQDGWLHTGDLGYYDDEGYFYVVDRLKDLIKYKSFQVAPAELEALLLIHPNIKEAAVVGVPDEVAGELPAAFIVKVPGKNLTEVDVHYFLEDKVSPEKKLRGGVQFVSTIPKNATGKILRRQLRQSLKASSKL